MSEFDKSERIGDVESRTIYRDREQRKIVYVIDHSTGKVSCKYDSYGKVEGTYENVSELEKKIEGK